MSSCHTCHVKRRWMSSCTTPATQSAAASQAPNPGPSAPPGTISATPATQNDGECEFVPRLPRETTVDVELYHACHAKCRGVTGAKSGPKGATRYHKCHACHAKRRCMDVSLCHACHVKRRWNDGGCEVVPRLPRKTKVDVW